MFVDGMGLARISKTLNDDRVSAPQPPRTPEMQAWCPSSIWEMLRNERYHGVNVWNKTRKAFNPETGRKITKARPKEEWKRVEVPEWRIVPETLWDAVQARIAHTSQKFSVAQLGGVNRTHKPAFTCSPVFCCAASASPDS